MLIEQCIENVFSYILDFFSKEFDMFKLYYVQVTYNYTNLFKYKIF